MVSALVLVVFVLAFLAWTLRVLNTAERAKQDLTVEPSAWEWLSRE